MKHDFLAALALQDEETVIDNVVNARDAYSILQNADWTTRAQVLATGLIHTEKKYPPIQRGMPTDSISSLLKDGREKKGMPVIGGYPDIIDKQHGFSDQSGLKISNLCCPPDSCLDLLPDGSALVRARLKLTRPFHSKDDRAFYPHSNPLKREWLFGSPYLAAGGVKGLLRWAWRMVHKDEKVSNSLEAVVFGPRSEEMKDENAQQGCLYIWPLFWEGQVGFEVINAQDRDTLAGTDPIKYEVVRAGATSTLHILLFNRAMEAPESFIRGIIVPVLAAVHLLLTDSGFSAKRSADWGSVKVPAGMHIRIKGVAQPGKTAEGKQETTAEPDPWLKVMDGEGNLLPFANPVYTNKMVATLTGKSEKMVKGKHRDDALQQVLKKWDAHQKTKQESKQPPPGEARPASYLRSAPSAEELVNCLSADFPALETTA